MTNSLCSAPRAVHCSKLLKECRPNRKSAFSPLPGNCSTQLRKLSVGSDHLQFVNTEDSQLPCPADLRLEVCTRNGLRIFLRNLLWENVFFFWGDERHVPPEDPESNYRMANESLLSKLTHSCGPRFSNSVRKARCGRRSPGLRTDSA